MNLAPESGSIALMSWERVLLCSLEFTFLGAAPGAMEGDRTVSTGIRNLPCAKTMASDGRMIKNNLIRCWVKAPDTGNLFVSISLPNAEETAADLAIRCEVQHLSMHFTKGPMNLVRTHTRVLQRHACGACSGLGCQEVVHELLRHLRGEAEIPLLPVDRFEAHAARSHTPKEEGYDFLLTTNCRWGDRGANLEDRVCVEKGAGGACHSRGGAPAIWCVPLLVLDIRRAIPGKTHRAEMLAQPASAGLAQHAVGRDMANPVETMLMGDAPSDRVQFGHQRPMDCRFSTSM